MGELEFFLSENRKNDQASHDWSRVWERHMDEVHVMRLPLSPKDAREDREASARMTANLTQTSASRAENTNEKSTSAITLMGWIHAIAMLKELGKLEEPYKTGIHTDVADACFK